KSNVVSSCFIGQSSFFWHNSSFRLLTQNFEHPLQNANNMVNEITTAAQKQMAITQDTVNNVAEISASVDATDINVSDSVTGASEAVDRTGKIIENTKAISQEGEHLRKAAQVLHESSQTLNELVEYFTI
ncbi:MAG: hypothetical protein CSB24_00345, partial [Deltaproteobacteria bacterium]